MNAALRPQQIAAAKKRSRVRARSPSISSASTTRSVLSVANTLMAYKPTPMLVAGRFSTYVNYMKRFFRPATEQGFKRVTGGNKLVAAAADEWDFLIDPPRVGEAIGLWRADVTGGNWQKLKTSSSSWSNQGLRYYKGLAWYRQTVDVPADAVGRLVFLWCGGVDEKAKVWVNGKPVGISPGAAFSPFELDATEAVRAGKNVITFCVVNDVVNDPIVKNEIYGFYKLHKQVQRTSDIVDLERQWNALPGSQ